MSIVLVPAPARMMSFKLSAAATAWAVTPGAAHNQPIMAGYFARQIVRAQVRLERILVTKRSDPVEIALWEFVGKKDFHGLSRCEANNQRRRARVRIRSAPRILPRSRGDWLDGRGFSRACANSSIECPVRTKRGGIARSGGISSNARKWWTTIYPEPFDMIGVPKGSRTPVAAVKGRCPRPLDDGDETRTLSGIWWSQAGSNRRPLQCHCSALPAELWPRTQSGAHSKPPEAGCPAARRPNSESYRSQILVWVGTAHYRGPFEVLCSLQVNCGPSKPRPHD